MREGNQVGRRKGLLLFRGHRSRVAFLIIILGALMPISNQAASLKLNPQLYLSYHYNNNVAGVDSLHTDPTVVQSLDALVGLETTYKTSHLELGTKGSLGTTYYLDANTNRHIATAKDLGNLSYLRAAAGVWATYNGRILSVDITDDILRTRSLSDLYGPQTDVISEIYLFTDNQAAIQFRYHPSPKTRVLLKYSYEYLFFAKADNDIFTVAITPVTGILLPPDSYEHRGFLRGEYDLNPRNTVSLDTQAGERIFLRRKVANVAYPYLDYNFLQGLLGYQHRFNERAEAEISAGGHLRQYFYEESDYPPSFFGGHHGLASGHADINPRNSNPVGRASFSYAIPKKFILSLSGEYSSSTYGQSIFYDYASGKLVLKYYLTRKIHAELNGSYNYDVFDLGRNVEYQTVWRHDRCDHIYVGQAGLYWDVILKNDEAWLKLGAGYMHQRRDSNIDKEKDYWDPAFFRSLDTDVDHAYAEVSFLPMILVGR